MAITGASTFRLANGKIQEIWGNMDRLGLMQQLDWLPRSAPASSETRHIPSLEFRLSEWT